MASWSCPVGWPAQGLARTSEADAGGVSGSGSGGAAGGIMAVCRSNRGDVLAVSLHTRMLFYFPNMCVAAVGRS